MFFSALFVFLSERNRKPCRIICSPLMDICLSLMNNCSPLMNISSSLINEFFRLQIYIFLLSEEIKKGKVC